MTGGSFNKAQTFIGELQLKMGESGNLMHMKRLDPFLKAMEEFYNISRAIDAFYNLSNIMAHVWVSTATRLAKASNGTEEDLRRDNRGLWYTFFAYVYILNSWNSFMDI
jgi:hypothetical protein